MRNDRHPGFALIELLVAIAIIGVLIAPPITAVQSAREAARRCQCIKNVKRLGPAIQGYLDAHGVMPLGSFKRPPPVGGDPCKGGHEAGVFVAISPGWSRAHSPTCSSPSPLAGPVPPIGSARRLSPRRTFPSRPRRS